MEPTGSLEDGGFESGQLRNDEPFGWSVNKVRGVGTSMSIDKGDAHGGVYSLRIDWTGNPSPSDEPVAQLLLVEPDKHYVLRFASRARNLITGGAPFVQITDVIEQGSLARSPKLPVGDSEWQNYSVEFTTGKLTKAIRIGIQREPCLQGPCPVFGTLRLDDFSVQRQENHPRRAE
jgi:hypothetical protein